MQGFGGHIVLGEVAHPEDYLLQRLVGVESNADYLLETLVEVVGAWLKGVVWQRHHAVDAFEGEIHNLALFAVGAKKIPPAVVLFEQVGMDYVRNVGIGLGKGVQMQLHHRFLRYGGEQLAEHRGAFQRIFVESHNPRAVLYLHLAAQRLQPLEIRQPVELSQ